MRIICHTLYDITKTGVNSRKSTIGVDVAELERQRSQQSNFETILQIISMRSQPEDITEPVKRQYQLVDVDWGYLYEKQMQSDAKKNPIHVWSFSFTVNHAAVFNNGIDELGNLNNDCHGVPIITRLEEWSRLSNMLSTNDELRNIYFRIANE